MKLVGTRDESQEVHLSEALLNPSANFGGLFTPKTLHKFDDSFFKKATKLSYNEIALEIIKSFNFDIEDEIFINALKKYEKFDDSNLPLKIEKLDDNLYINELFHGPTRAFKDMALQPFGEVINALANKNNKKYLIMCATSGDTGPATLEAFANKENVKVVCLYPANGTSEVQRLQMVNANAKNLKVIGINGNFDDAQRALKTLLKDDEFKQELKNNNLSLSAANSVNFGRILFQIIYHFYAYIWFLKNNILKDNETFDIVVPSGNFGNALGAYYAKKMGARIDTIKIASNENNVLTTLFNDGIYDIRNKNLKKTMSPAMDILISSNIERLLFHEFGDTKTKEFMEDLEKNKFYKIDHINGFEALYCTDEECSKFIKQMADNGKLVDPHTATCLKFKPTKTTIVTSTAHWVKFTPSMIKAVKNSKITDEKKQMVELAKEFNDEIPNEILNLFESKTIHKSIVDKDKIKEKILEWVKL